MLFNENYVLCNKHYRKSYMKKKLNGDWYKVYPYLLKTNKILTCNCCFFRLSNINITDHSKHMWIKLTKENRNMKIPYVKGINFWNENIKYIINVGVPYQDFLIH